MPMHQELSAAAQTAFAGLAQAARMAEINRTVADLPGGFVKKTIRGTVYWYYQVKSPDGKLHQAYIGAESPATLALMASHQDPSAKASQVQLVNLTRAAIELGCASVIPKHARIIERLADHGFFRAGGILVGTHAFLSYQNLFGVLWTSGVTTVDLYFAHTGKNISIAVPSNMAMDRRKAIDSLQMGFVPNNDQTTYKKADEPDLDLDFLTALHRSGDAPLAVPALNITLQPLKFMEFSMEATLPAVLLSRAGPIVVNVPRPERYAVHKLAVYGERPQNMRTKARKDLDQAAALIEYLARNDADALALAWENFNGRGPGWRKRAEQGREALASAFPEIGTALPKFRRPNRPGNRPGQAPSRKRLAPGARPPHGRQ